MSSGNGPENEIVRWVQARFDVSDKNALDLKTSIIGLSRGVTLLKADLEGAKVAATAAAVGLTLFKADFTVFKMDEKGLSLFGNQFKAWPWSDWQKRWERRYNEETQNLTNQLMALKGEIEELDGLKSRRTALQRQNSASQGGNSGNSYLLNREREIAQEIQELERRVQRSQRTIEQSAKYLEDSNIKKNADSLRLAAKTAEENKKKVEKNYEALVGIIHDDEKTVESLARQLAPAS
ncbi:hypothetical protein [Streptomyces prunicolor]|uniref:hypothetical protein n=1 Tax=Streptomyces prunicolor TaxID=67348 RepID=UPI003424A72B